VKTNVDVSRIVVTGNPSRVPAAVAFEQSRILLSLSNSSCKAASRLSAG